MLQKLVAQACTFGGTFDQTWHIGDHEALRMPNAHHTQVRVQGGKRVVCNFRASI